MPKKTTADAIELPSIMNLSVAENLREVFLEHMASDNDLSIEASKVDTITTPCVQVIIATGRSLEETGKSLAILNSSPAFDKAVTDLGLTEIFAKWSTK